MLTKSSFDLNENKVNIFDKYYLSIFNNEINPIQSSSSLSSYITTQHSENIDIKQSNNFHSILTHYIIPYLSPNDLLNFKLCNKLVCSLINQKAINQNIISNSTKGFPSNNIRYKIWSFYLGIENYKKEIFKDKQFINEDKKDEEYYNETLKIVELIKKNDESIKKEYKEDKLKQIYKSFEIIEKDIGRTFNFEYFKTGNGKKELKNVLEGISVIKENVGYCQGMNFIVGALIFLFKSEIKAFYAFNCLLNSYDLKSLFCYNTPDYNVRVYQLNYYVKKYIPSVYYHFKNNDLSFDLLYSNWILTFFANYFSVDTLDFPWTCFFIDQWKGLLKVCLIIIYDLSHELIKCDLFGISELIKEKKYMDFHKNLKRSYELYSRKFKIKNSELKYLRDEYYINLVKEKLEKTKKEINKWDNDQIESLNNYLKEKDKNNINSKRNIENYKLMMEKINKKYLSSFKKYTNQITIINKIKRKIDDLATEKLSYEKIFSIYKKEENNLLNKNLNNNLNPETRIQNLKEKRNKKELIEKEMNKIVVKYLPVIKEYDKFCDLLYKKINSLDKYKIQIENYKKEKDKNKEIMNNYFFLCEQKENELLKGLVEKLKSSNNFIKNNNF